MKWNLGKLILLCGVVSVGVARSSALCAPAVVLVDYLTMETGDGSWQGDARPQIQIALGLLQQATAADTEGATDVALKLYHETVSRFDNVINIVPPQYASVIAKHMTTTKQRLETLKKEKSLGGVTTASSNSFPAFPINFIAQPLPVYDEQASAPPAATVLRPFWMMHLLSQSMQSGAYITPSIYVSKSIWLQDGATTVVAGIGPKVKYLSVLCELLHDVQLLSHSDPRKFAKGLDEFLQGADECYNLFAQEVGKKGANSGAGADGAPMPQRSKFNRGVRELLHRGQSVLKSWKLNQDATYSSYIAWAVNVFEQAQLFDRWIHYFSESSEAPPEILERLHRVATVFYVGPCRFLLHDMFLLVERYTERSRESISRLLPGNIVLKDAHNGGGSSSASVTPTHGPAVVSGSSAVQPPGEM